jgi:hypothetical protein
MAQTLFSHRHLSHLTQAEQDQRKQLEAEKWGVIGGFLVGLPLGLGEVHGLMTSLGSPAWLAGAVAVVAVAASTAAGLRLASALVSRQRHAR